MNQQIKQAISKAAESYRSKEYVVASSDLLLQYDPTNGTIRFFDDTEELISESKLSNPITEQQFVEVAEEVLRQEDLVSLVNEMDIIKPFSVVLVDNEFAPKKELLTIYDETIFLDEQFLHQYNNDLDQFLKHLMDE